MSNLASRTVHSFGVGKGLVSAKKKILISSNVPLGTEGLFSGTDFVQDLAWIAN